MNILTIIPSYKPAYHYGGPIRSVASLCEAMVREGHKVTVFTSNANGKEKLSENRNTPHFIDGVEVYYFNRWTGDHSNLTPHLLRSIWTSAKSYDAVHIHSWWNLVVMPAVMICLLRGIRPVLSPRGSITPYTFNHHKAALKRLMHRLVGKYLMQHCVMHVTSQQEEEDVKQFTKPALLFNIPNFLELKSQVTTDQKNCDTLRLVYLGRIDPKKNIDFILGEVLHDFDIPHTLEIIGEGDEAYTNLLKQKTSNNKSISWLGPIYDDQKWLKLASNDLLLLPSANENYGNVVLEALSQGTAVLISDHVGLKDYILDNNLGWVAKMDGDAWREILRDVFKDRSMLHQIRSKAPLCIQRDFNQTMLVSQYVEMYKVAPKSPTFN